MSFVFYAYGHPAVRSAHPTTLEITKQEHLTREGDCIVAVKSSKGPSDVPRAITKVLSTPSGRGRLSIQVDSLRFIVEGRGAHGLSFSHPTDIVVRKSGFVSDRTLMVHADKAAIDVPRELVSLLQDSKKRITIEISAFTPAGQP